MTTTPNYVDPLLSNVAKGYRPLGHINELVLPRLGVKKPTAKIGVYDASNLRIVSSIKAPEGETPTVTMNVSTTDAYTLENHALKALASDEAAENQDRPFDEQRDKAEFVMDLLSVAREYALGSYMNTVGNFTNTTTLSGTGQWGGSADDPVGDLNTAIGTVGAAIGVPESMVSLVMPANVYRKLVTLDEIKGTLGHKYTKGSLFVQPSDIANALNIRQVIIAESYYNSADDGQTDSLSAIWGKHCWAVYIPSNPKIKEMSFGYTVRRKNGVYVDKWYDSDRKGWWVRGNDEWDQYIMNELALYMIENAIA